MSGEMRVWGIHTMDDNLFLHNSVIAIGWEEMGNLSSIPNDREAFKSKYIAVYPDAKKGSVSTCAGMLLRFAYEMQTGDYVVFPSKIDRKINIGVIESPYYYKDNAHHYKNQRKVKWLKHLPRNIFPQGALYEVGSALTLFTVKNYPEEFLGALDNTPVIRGTSGSELVELVLKYYDNLDEKYRKIIPLQRVYIPALNVE